MIHGIPSSAWFVYRDGELYCDGVPVRAIAAEIETPLYLYAGGAIDAAIREIDEALAFAPHLIAYAVKANGNLAILARLAAHGCGADIVSEGELHRALKAGMPPDRIRFTGVGKRRREIVAAVDAGVAAIHVESGQELDLVEEVARELGKTIPIGIRVNPDVDADTHPYIATGLRDNKFGVTIPAARALLPRVVESDQVELEAVATHIGSQLSSPKPLQEAVQLVGAFAVECLQAGAPLRSIDVGGGWPMNYGHEETPYPPHAVFGAAIEAGLRAAGALDRGLTIVTEPGRAIVGDAGALVTRVLYTKTQGDKRFAIVDAAMTELIRPALYQAYHAIMPVTEPDSSTGTESVDIVGPVCESGDFLAQSRELPLLSQGDLILVRGAGAYGREMQSTYNARRISPEVLVDGDRHCTIRERPDHESLWIGEPTD